jgi:hypothetical protein
MPSTNISISYQFLQVTAVSLSLIYLDKIQVTLIETVLIHFKTTLKYHWYPLFFLFLFHNKVLHLGQNFDGSFSIPFFLVTHLYLHRVHSNSLVLIILDGMK